MAKTDWGGSDAFQRTLPHTFAAMQKFVMSMAKTKKNQGRSGWFGRDKGLDAFREFEGQIGNLVRAMLLDGMLSDTRGPDDIRRIIIETVATWAEIYPNWQDAYRFAESFFVEMPAVANELISGAMRSR
jgi:hypothetical protein